MTPTESMTYDVLFSTKSLIKQVNEYLKELANVEKADGLYKFILADFVSLNKFFIATGDQAYNTENDQETANLDEIYLIHYTLSESFKDIALLHRDVLLELQISRNKFLEKVVSENAVSNHYKNSKDILIQATEAFIKEVDKQQNILLKSDSKEKKILNKIKHRKNPWSIYKEHFTLINYQINDISKAAVFMSKIIKTFEDIRKHNNSFLDSANNDAEMLKSKMGEGIGTLKELKEISQITDVINWVDSALTGINKDKDLQELYMTTIEQKIKMLTSYTIPVGTNDGLMLTRKMDFNRAVKKWIDFEILPLLIDLMENKNNMTSYFKHSIVNLKTGLLIEKNNASIEAFSSQLQSVKSVHAALSVNSEKIKSLVSEIYKKFEEQFKVTQIYSQTDFLEVSLQSSLTHFTSDQSTLFSELKKQLKSTLSHFSSKYESSSLFNSQNKIETALSCINYRMFKEADAHYDTLFLNKNFMGDLFLLPREEQEADILNSINHWRNGFNKAILIVGDGLCGKSTFVNQIVHNHFAKHHIVLEKNCNNTFNGRKFTTTADLGDALQEIKKGLDRNHSLLIIDNLELWKDDQHTLLDNIRALISFIESESDEILVMVTTSEQMQDHLNNRLRFSEIFTSKINLNKATIQEIYNAVLMRHGASHKTLVDSNGEEISKAQIERDVHKLAKMLDYNIGEVLQAWTYGTTMTADNKVICNQNHFPFTDFFTAEEIIILKYVLLYKQVNELTLKSFVGSRYNGFFRSALKRLVNTKILIREESGLLHLNSVLYKDVKQLLIYKGTLN